MGSTSDVPIDVYNRVVDDIVVMLRNGPMWSREMENTLMGYKRTSLHHPPSSKREQLIFEYSESDTNSDTDSEKDPLSAMPAEWSDCRASYLRLNALAKEEEEEEEPSAGSVCSWDSSDSSPRGPLDLID